MKTHLIRSCASPKAGFTLLELMIASVISLSVIAMSMVFMTDTLKINYTNSYKNANNQKIRNIVDRMAIEAKQANSFMLYSSAVYADRDEVEDRIRTGESGDCFLMIYKAAYSEMEDLGADPLHDPRPIRRIVIYYRSITSVENGVGRGPVYRWETDFGGTPVTDADKVHNVEKLIPAMSTLSAQSQLVVAFSEGLADGRLFFNYQNKTVMINGKMIHGSNYKWVTDTYNFSVSPRG